MKRNQMNKREKQINNHIANTKDLYIGIFRGTLVLSMVACAIYALSSIGVSDRKLIGIFAIGAFFFCGLFLIATYYISRIEIIYFLFLFVLSGIGFPIYFSMNGGMTNSDQMFLLILFILPFVFLSGKILILISIMCIVSYAAAYSTYVQEFGLYEVLMGYGSVILLGLLCGILIHNQTRNIQREQNISEDRRKDIEKDTNSKTLYFANMSHEIRTPINTIIGLNEMNLRQDTYGEIKENASIIAESGRELLTLINDILDWSKIESGKMEIVPVDYRTEDLLRDVIGQNFPAASEKELDFYIDIDDKIPSGLRGDAVHIRQILNNILENAIRYTSQGSVILSVGYESLNENEAVLNFSVEDTGIGIKKENLADLFTVFKTADKGAESTHKGTGLGLSISKSLIDLMGGSIKVDSIHKKGSIFRITLTQQVNDPAAIGNLKFDAKEINRSKMTVKHSFEAPNAHILAVDDNEMNLVVLKKLLRDTKINVDCASGGRECLDKTLTTNYHLILMDHLMPDMDGAVTLEKLRQRHEGLCINTPVVALTANASADSKDTYRNLGFDDYLGKPLSSMQLEDVLLKYLPKELIQYTLDEKEDAYDNDNTPLIFHKDKKKFLICATDVCDIPNEWAEQYDIRIIPSYIVTKEGRFMVNQEISTTEVLDCLKDGRELTSISPPEPDLERFFAECLTEAEQVIFFCMSSSLVDEIFTKAIRMSEYFNNVTVVDSQNITTGMAFVLREVALLAMRAGSVDEILNSIADINKNISTSFVVDTVDLMYQRKYVGKSVRNISKMFNVHPILCMRHNKLAANGFCLGSWENAAKKYIRSTLRNGKHIDDEVVIITYTGLSFRQIEMITEEVKKLFAFKKIIYRQTNATIAAVCGFGTFGLMFLKRQA